jgi:hypothetical protein
MSRETYQMNYYPEDDVSVLILIRSGIKPPSMSALA